MFLNDYCHIQGGASRIAIDEAVALAETGIRVIFLGATGPVGRELAESQVDVRCLDQPDLAGGDVRTLAQGLWNRLAARAMEDILAKLDPGHTVVHLHGYTKSLTTSPVRVAADRGFRVLCTLHDFFIACPNGGLFDFKAGRPCGARPLSPACLLRNCDKRARHHKIYRVARSLVQRGPGRLPGGVRDFIGLSRHSVELLRSALPEGARIHWLENIIDVERLPPVDVAANHRPVAVGRLDPEKGVALALEAAGRGGVTITFVGDGPLRGQAEAAGHRVTGWLPPALVAAELSQARCLLFPSLWYETYGLVVSEAAARGVPAIVSDVSAAAERVHDGCTGMVFPSGDADRLAQCLVRMTDGALAASLGRAAYQAFWAAPPTRANHLERLQDIYAAMLAG